MNHTPLTVKILGISDQFQISKFGPNFVMRATNMEHQWSQKIHIGQFRSCCQCQLPAPSFLFFWCHDHQGGVPFHSQSSNRSNQKSPFPPVEKNHQREFQTKIIGEELERFLKRSILDLKGWGNDLKWPLKWRNLFKRRLTLNQFIQRMGNITPAKLISLIVWNVIYRVVKKKKFYSRRRVRKKTFFSTHPPDH